MPADTNPLGDIFRGGFVSRLDLAGSNMAAHTARIHVATVAMDGLKFHWPVKGG